MAVESFDGTDVATVVYVPPGVSILHPAPAILAGHDGAGPEDGFGDPDPDLLSPPLQALLRAGFVVQTWAARGFAPSEGLGLLNSPNAEVRDVQALVDYLGTRRDVVQDGRGDPRVGMVGQSYGGWIQLLVAQRDPRIDAISPRWTLYDPVEDFQPNGVLRSGWTALVESVITTGANFDASVHDVFRDALRRGALTESGRAFLRYRSVESLVDRIDVPTLLIQSVSDTFTTADNAIAIYHELRQRRVPVGLYLFCGGHTQTLFVGNAAGISCNPTAAHGRIPDFVVQWMTDHLVERDGGPPESWVRWELQDGRLLERSDWSSVHSGTALKASLAATLATSGAPYEDTTVAAMPSPDGVRTRIDAAPGDIIVGSPRVRIEMTGWGSEAFAFSKLLDVHVASGRLLVIDEQATPIRFANLSSEVQMRSFSMAAVSWEVEPGHKLLYEVSSTSNGFAASRAPSLAQVSVTVTVPVAASDDGEAASRLA